MSTTVFQDQDQGTYIASGAIPANRRVIFSHTGGALRVSLAGLTDKADGVSITSAAEAGERIQIRRVNGSGTFAITSVLAVTNPSTVLFGAADGKVSTAQGVGAFAEFISLQSGGIDEVLEAYYKPGFTAGTE